MFVGCSDDSKSKLNYRSCLKLQGSFCIYVEAYTPSQAHLQGTQCRHTKANLAKKPNFCQRFRNTPCFVGHIL